MSVTALLSRELGVLTVSDVLSFATVVWWMYCCGLRRGEKRGRRAIVLEIVRRERKGRVMFRSGRARS